MRGIKHPKLEVCVLGVPHKQVSHCVFLKLYEPLKNRKSRPANGHLPHSLWASGNQLAGLLEKPLFIDDVPSYKPPWLGHGDFPASHRFMAGGYKLGNPRTWLRPAGKIIERNGGCSRKQCLIAGGYPEFLNCGWIWWIIHLFFRKCECMKLYDHKQWGSLFMGPHRFIGSSLARYSNPQIDSR